MRQFGEFSLSVFCPFPSSENMWILNGAWFKKTGLWWWSPHHLKCYKLSLCTLSPQLLLSVFSGLTVWEANLLTEARKSHLKDPAQALSIIKKYLPTGRSNMTSPSRAQNEAENPAGLPCCFQWQHFGFNAYLAGKIMHRENVRMHSCSRD